MAVIPIGLRALGTFFFIEPSVSLPKNDTTLIFAANIYTCIGVCVCVCVCVHAFITRAPNYSPVVIICDLYGILQKAKKKKITVRLMQAIRIYSKDI